MTRRLFVITASLVLASVPVALRAQQEGPVPTQVLVSVESKSGVVPTPADINAEVNGKPTPITSLAPVQATNVEIALLLDDGLRQSVGVQLQDIKDWILHLPPGTAVFVGYMQNGRVVPAQQFTTDYAAAAAQLRLPFGMSGANGSPYFSLSDFVKSWPGPAVEPAVPGQRTTGSSPSQGQPRARFVMMLTNGVDLYNGSVSPLNQDSPYVQASIEDAQRTGIPVYSIYYSDRGIRGGLASFSGQGYLSQVAEGTGGTAYFQGTMNPVSLSPFLTRFNQAIASTYIATFDAVARKKDPVVRLKLSSREKGLKLHAASAVQPGGRL